MVEKREAACIDPSIDRMQSQQDRGRASRNDSSSSPPNSEDDDVGYSRTLDMKPAVVLQLPSPVLALNDLNSYYCFARR